MEATAGFDVVVFELDGSLYAISAGTVLEMARAVATTPLPNAPAIVEGIIDVRGRIVPQVDVRSRFRHAPRPLSPSDHLIVAVSGDRPVALRVDRIVEVRTLRDSEVEPLPSMAGDPAFLRGVSRTEDGLVLIHDLAQLLSDREGGEIDSSLRRAAESQVDS